MNQIQQIIHASITTKEKLLADDAMINRIEVVVNLLTEAFKNTPKIRSIFWRSSSETISYIYLYKYLQE